jgi:hypothetical protein
MLPVWENRDKVDRYEPGGLRELNRFSKSIRWIECPDIQDFNHGCQLYCAGVTGEMFGHHACDVCTSEMVAGERSRYSASTSRFTGLVIGPFRLCGHGLHLLYLPGMFCIACASPKCAMTAEAGGRNNVDRMQLPCCMEDGGRPSGGGLQDQPSNRPALRGDKLPGSERTGKRRA